MIRFASKSVFGFWSFLVVLGAYAFLFVIMLANWRGDAVLTIRGFSNLTWILMMILAGIASVDAARFSTAERAFLFTEKKSANRSFIFLFAATFIPVAIVHAVSMLCALVAAEAFIRNPFVIALAVIAQLASLAWAIAFGSALGRFLPPIVAGPIAAIAMFVMANTLMGQSSSVNRIRILGDTGASIPQTGLTWNVNHLLVQVLFLTVTGLILLTIDRMHMAGRHMPSIKTCLTGLATIGSLVVATVTIPGTPMVENGVRADRCIKGATEICVFDEHVQGSHGFIEVLNALVSAAKDHGYDALVPTRIVESSVRGWDPAIDPASGTRMVPPLSPDIQGETAYIAQYLAAPLWCDELSSSTPPPEKYFEDNMNVTTTWLSIAGFETETIDGSTILTPKEVDEIFQRWKTCSLQ